MEILRSIDQQEEQEIRQMQDRQRQLHLIPTPLCYVSLEVTNKNGDVTSTYNDRSKSWVRNFYNWMAQQQMTCGANILGSTYGAGSLIAQDTSGGSRNTERPMRHQSTTDGSNYGGFRSNNTDYGILVGTGTTAESFESYELTTLVENGTASGQMQYSNMDTPTPVWDGTAKTMTYSCERAMTNNSSDAGTIAVAEVGLVGSISEGFSFRNYLCARDLLSTAVNVAFESQLKVTYTIQITYPA